MNPNKPEELPLTMLEAGTASQLRSLIALSSAGPADLLPALETLGDEAREAGYVFRPGLVLAELYPDGGGGK